MVKRFSNHPIASLLNLPFFLACGSDKISSSKLLDVIKILIKFKEVDLNY